MCICSMCYDDKPVSAVVEDVSGFEMLFFLCDECLVRYVHAASLKLDGYIHRHPIEDYDQLSREAQFIIDRVLSSVGLDRNNWNNWRR